MRMRLAAAAAVAVALVAGTAGAATIYSNNFDTENAGLSALSYTGFTGASVILGTVDLVHTGDGFGISCAGGPGGCVDLNGSTNSQSDLRFAPFAFEADTTYEFSFKISGNQRNAETQSFRAGFQFDSVQVLNGVTLGGAYGDFTDLVGSSLIGASLSQVVVGTDPFRTYTLAFSTKGAGTAQFFLEAEQFSNIGPIADDVVIRSVTAGVPEASTWALMISGFGLSGAAIRRRRALRAA